MDLARTAPRRISWFHDAMRDDRSAGFLIDCLRYKPLAHVWNAWASRRPGTGQLAPRAHLLDKAILAPAECEYAAAA